MIYETVPTTNDDEDESEEQVYEYDDFPGVTVQINTARHEQAPVMIGKHQWKRSTLKIYPGRVVPGANRSKANGWYVTGEATSDGLPGVFSRCDPFDANEEESITDSLGSNVLFIPTGTGLQNSSLSEYIVDEWDGGNRQDE